ncbi:hypothetical protein SETIT_9G029100v2 [Setaria italica]|uniref:Uncharacterized protein n=1 Tax=Setaria italica TaxID=4555 RepID=A0A368SCR1_SETIT|nr:hypothetical protein SETIT_9G029100v2 [Setaria italica]
MFPTAATPRPGVAFSPENHLLRPLSIFFSTHPWLLSLSSGEGEPGLLRSVMEEVVGSVELKPAQRRPRLDLVEMSFMVELEAPRPANYGHP